MRQFKRRSLPVSEFNFDQLPWLPEGLKESLAVIVAFLRESFGVDLLKIGLYGSWQRGDASPDSDVDLVVFLACEAAWFDAEQGIVNRSAARKDRMRWRAIEKKANSYRTDTKVYSIAAVTPGMLAYYSTQGPIHLQNWVHALKNCYSLWEGEETGKGSLPGGGACFEG